jgi:hypothetical protein
MKLNIEKCFLGNTKVSYLGFVFTQEGIKPGRDKLRAVKAPQPQADMKAVSSFIGLCNFSEHTLITLQQSTHHSQN